MDIRANVHSFSEVQLRLYVLLDSWQANSFPSDNEDFKETTQEFENIQATTCNLADDNGPSDKRSETTARGHSGTEPPTNGLVDRKGVPKFPSDNNAVTTKLLEEADKKEPEMVSRIAVEGEQALEEVAGREVERKVPESCPQENEPVPSEGLSLVCFCRSSPLKNIDYISEQENQHRHRFEFMVVRYKRLMR